MQGLVIGEVQLLSYAAPYDAKGTTEDEAVLVSSEVAAEVEGLMSRHGLADDVCIATVEYETACVLTTLTLAIKVTAVAGTAAYALKNFKKIREGLILLLRDVDHMRMIATDSGKKFRTWLYRDGVLRGGRVDEWLENSPPPVQPTEIVIEKKPRRRRTPTTNSPQRMQQPPGDA